MGLRLSMQFYFEAIASPIQSLTVHEALFQAPGAKRRQRYPVILRLYIRDVKILSQLQPKSDLRYQSHQPAKVNLLFLTVLWQWAQVIRQYYQNSIILSVAIPKVKYTTASANLQTQIRSMAINTTKAYYLVFQSFVCRL